MLKHTTQRWTSFLQMTTSRQMAETERISFAICPESEL